MKKRPPVGVLLALFLGLLAASSGGVRAQSGFSPNQELPLPLTAGQLPVSFVVRGLEPSVRVDPQGTVYVATIRGVPGGVDLHRWSPAVDPPPNADGTYPFKYEGQPDGCGILAGGCSLIGIAEGGGDVDLAVNYPSTGVPNLALTSLTLAPSVTATHSTDRGDHFTNPNPVAALVPGDDRMWMDGTDAQRVYVSYHDAATFNLEVQRSADGGQTYLDGFGEAIDPATFPAAGGVPATNTSNVAASIRVDRSGCPSRGNLYQMFAAPDSAPENLQGKPFRSTYVGVSTDVNLGLSVFTFTDHKIATGPEGSSAGNIFPALDVDARGNLYAAWSDNSSILYSFSTDLGTSWSPAVRINGGSTVGMPNVFPWVAADANGHVGIVWFGGDRAGNSNDATIHEPCLPASPDCMKQWTNWNVYYAETVNGHDPTPLFTQSVISDHAIHRGTVSTGGLGGGANRNLADYFQIAFDPQHRANVAFSDDHKVHPLGPDNGPDNPSTRRLTRANFTRQLEPAPGIVTTGACAGGAPPEAARKVTGDGRLGTPVNFGLIAKESPLNGALQYQDDRAALKARSQSGIDSVTFSGSCATITGNARVNDQNGYRFSVRACDVADPGARRDTLSVDLTGPQGFAYHKEGTLTDGNIQTRP